MRSYLSRSLVCLIAFSFACSLLGVLSGCSSDGGRDRSAKAVGTLKDTREELANSRKQVDEVLASLSALQAAQGDLRAPYDKYKKEVKETEDQAKKVSDRAADMQARAAEYQAKWQDEMATVTNPDLKAAAQARSAKVRDRYAAIQGKAGEVKAAYEPFIRELKDVQTYLSNDLTPPALKAADPVFGKAKASGQTLNQKIDALAAELDAVAAEMAPGAPK